MIKELESLLSAKVPPEIPISFVPPANPDHGDLATAVAFSLASLLKRAPNAIAKDLAILIEEHPFVKKVAVVGGYINVTLQDVWWCKILETILSEGIFYGHCTEVKKQKVSVEYVSANPTGPLHGAHARIAILGDVLANLLQASGYEVVREYFINDAGQQIHTLARTVYIHYKALIEQSHPIIPEGYYPGDYVRDIAESFLAEEGHAWLSKSEDQWLPKIASFAVRAVMKDIQEDLHKLGIFHTVFTSEKALQTSGRVNQVIAELDQKGFVYKGVLEAPKGKGRDTWQPSELLLFRSTAFGDDQDRPLQREDKAWTYFAGDIAYHQEKIAQGCRNLFNVWGADHDSHVKRMQAAVTALSDSVSLEVVISQMVRFFHQGNPIKMSKRAGTFVSLKDILELIDAESLRFMLLTKKADTHLDLDIDQMKAQTKDNPLFYVQYAHARCHSVLRLAKTYFSEVSLMPEALKNADLASLIQAPPIRELINLMGDWPRQLHQAALHREPHRITTYLYRLAQEFHALWQQGNQQASLRFLQPDHLQLSYAYSALLQALAFVIASGLTILGIEPKEEMHG